MKAYFAASFAILLTACGSQPQTQVATPAPLPAKPVESAPYSLCTFPETNVQAPRWVCDEPVPGYTFLGLGVAEKHPMIQFMRDTVRSSAFNEIGASIETNVKLQVQADASQHEKDGVATFEALATTAAKSASEIAVRNAKSVTSINCPVTGRLYSLWGITDADVKKALREALRNSSASLPDQWEEVYGDQAPEAVADEIAGAIATD